MVITLIIILIIGSQLEVISGVGQQRQHEGNSLTRMESIPGVEDVNYKDMGSYNYAKRERIPVTSKHTVNDPIHRVQISKPSISIQSKIDPNPPRAITVNNSPNQSSSSNCHSTMVYLKRVVGSIIEQMGVRHHVFGPGDTITIDLRGEISYASYIALTKFIDTRNTDNSSNQLQKIAEIMSALLHTVHHSQPTAGSWEYIKENILLRLPNILSLKFWLIAFTITIVGFLSTFLIYEMIRSRNNLVRLFVFSICLVVVLSTVWVYAENAEREEAINAARLEQYETLPRDCQYYNFTATEKLGYFFRVKVFRNEDQCIEYYKERNIDPFYRTTPVEAMGDTIARLFLHPMGYIGGKIGDFLNAVTVSVAWWMQPIVLIFVLFFTFNYFIPFRIRTPLFCIEPAFPNYQQLPQPPSSNNGQAVMERPASAIVPLHHLDVATDTDDLEEYILMNLNQRPPPRPAPRRRNLVQSRFYRVLNTFYQYLNSTFNFLLKILRDCPPLNENLAENYSGEIH